MLSRVCFHARCSAMHKCRFADDDHIVFVTEKQEGILPEYHIAKILFSSRLSLLLNDPEHSFRSEHDEQSNANWMSNDVAKMFVVVDIGKCICSNPVILMIRLAKCMKSKLSYCANWFAINSRSSMFHVVLSGFAIAWNNFNLSDCKNRLTVFFYSCLSRTARISPANFRQLFLCRPMPRRMICWISIVKVVRRPQALKSAKQSIGSLFQLR